MTSRTFWNDPVNGDQEQQTETRSEHGRPGKCLVFDQLVRRDTRMRTKSALQLRDDSAYVNRLHTLYRQPLAYCSVLQVNAPALQVAAPGGVCNADQVQLLDVGPYLETTTHWLSWLRTVLGVREEYYRASDHSVTTGFQGETSETLLQPKGSVILGPFAKTEFYFSAGRGFHSDDVRGVFGTVPVEGVPGRPRHMLLALTQGLEFGVRSDLIPKLSTQLAVFQQDFDSELAYDADAGYDAASAPSSAPRRRILGSVPTDAVDRIQHRPRDVARTLPGRSHLVCPCRSLDRGCAPVHRIVWCAGEQSGAMVRWPAVAQARPLSDQ